MHIFHGGQSAIHDPAADPPLTQIGAAPVLATLRELLEGAAEARRHGDHGAAVFLETAALVALRREVQQ